MAEQNKILGKMLDRLLGRLVNGPSVNCRPYASRQRVDVAMLAKFGDVAPTDALRDLLAQKRKTVVKASIPKPKANGRGGEKPILSASVPPVSPALEAAPSNIGEKAAVPKPEHAWLEQQSVLNKLHTIAEDARTYEQDTGVSVLHVGFPLLSLPAGTSGGGRGANMRRVLAPIAFVPIHITVKRGAASAVELACKEEGVDRVIPNSALFAWLEQQTGKPPIEQDEDEQGTHPWREISDIVQAVCSALEMPIPPLFAKPAAPEQPPGAEPPEAPAPPAQEYTIPPFDLLPAPRADESGAGPAILTSAVLGLFPLANQGLLRDTQAMASADTLNGPVENFIRLSVDLETPAKVVEPASSAPAGQASPAVLSEERFITGVDPCQARAVRLARDCPGLVVHGPPGTGKSQTITNIIGDHLARGQRVLVVCDKRTALDVVFNRLTHMGLGNLCALVHDPRRDQRELYKSIRQQLDELNEAKSDSRAKRKLASVNEELQSLYDELSQYRAALSHCPDENGRNFHELVGQWLDLAHVEANAAAIGSEVPLAALEAHGTAVADLLKRGESAGYGTNPWVAAAGLSLAEFLATQLKKIRAAVEEVQERALASDKTLDPDIPPFLPALPLKQQAEARQEFAGRISKLLQTADGAILARWAREPADRIDDARRQLAGAEPFVRLFRVGSLDAELLENLRGKPLESLPFASDLLFLAEYLEFAKKWYSFLPLKPKRNAAAVTTRCGLTLNPANAERLKDFLGALRARLKLSELLRSFFQEKQDAGANLLPDERLGRALTDHQATLDLLLYARNDENLRALAEPRDSDDAGSGDRVEIPKEDGIPHAGSPQRAGAHPSRIASALTDPAAAKGLLGGLQKSAPRAAALEILEAACSRSHLFAVAWLATQFADIRAGNNAGERFAALQGRLSSLEGVLRVRQGLAGLPAELRGAVEAALAESMDAVTAQSALRRSAINNEITARLRAEPRLQEIDGHRLEIALARYRELDEQKRELTRAALQRHWLAKQQDRLLAGSGGRLNSLGAELRRRLLLRGERAMRLRQVIAVGGKIEGGDPLFDLCPVWLCSPETVAQIFPREPLFDVVVFDEASQLRLEESLPVLMRGKRVVIAGDPKQLPPTRFFESAVSASEDEDADTDQGLFEQEQGEIEDLLTAALGLDIQQCYLDVHYRSRSGDLIAFSNKYFYGSRLQPIPNPPSTNGDAPPSVELEQVGGTYDRRQNEVEAGRIVEIVRELLDRKDPPSIGIACFNLVQRDLVAEKLDELAAGDISFAKNLEKARQRQGVGSFEGLFVKNLENVQGDERDYILISTTYGPDKTGKFYRRFGPLARAGGGRRLNVLVTRAREKVHVITSIPASEFRALPQLEQGQTPGGAWLLFAYLKFADDLARRCAASSEAPEPAGAGQSTEAAEVIVRPSRSPSSFAEALARRLAAEQHLGSDVHWGNEGFCVDVALRRAPETDGKAAGVLCDGARYSAADDPVQWDIFRTAILENQGWKLRRLWTPHFYRDPQGQMKAIAAMSKNGD